MAQGDRVALLGALLFAAGEPLAKERLAAVVESSGEELEGLLEELARRASGIGLVLLEHQERVQLATAPELHTVIRMFLGHAEEARLSPAALETLAIVAYAQPVTRAEIDAIRGVDSTAALQTLLAHGLIEPLGRRSAPGQPIEYGTTVAFLERFGLAHLAALPPLPEEVRQLLAARRDPH